MVLRQAQGATLRANEIMTAMSTRTMRAYVLTAPREGEIQEVPAPVAAPGEVIVDVKRVGLCGTDVEFFTGEMAYLHQGYASYPMRLGHEWAGTVGASGAGSTRRGSVAGLWVTPCSATACADVAGMATSTFARTGRRLAYAAGVPAPWLSSWLYRPRRCTSFPTPWTSCSARWWSRAAVHCGQRRLRR